MPKIDRPPDGIDRRMDSSKVYIVDDEPIVRSSLVALISSMGIETEAFASGDELLQSFVSGEPALQCVLADLRMPVMNGLELKRELLNQQHRVPVVLLTGYCERETIEHAESLGIFEILEKPCRPETLENTIRRAFDSNATAR